MFKLWCERVRLYFCYSRVYAISDALWRDGRKLCKPHMRSQFNGQCTMWHENVQFLIGCKLLDTCPHVTDLSL